MKKIKDTKNIEDDEQDDLSADLELRDLLFNRAMVKPPAELEARVMAACQEALIKRQRNRSLLIKIKEWFSSVSNTNMIFKYAMPMAGIAMSLFIIIGLGWYKFAYKDTTEIGTLHNTPTPIAMPTDGMRSGDGVALSLKEIKKLYIKLGSDPWSIKLAQEITLSVKQLNWAVVTDPKSADAGLRLDKNKLIIFNKANNILWEKEINLSANPTDLTQIVIADLKKS